MPRQKPVRLSRQGDQHGQEELPVRRQPLGSSARVFWEAIRDAELLPVGTEAETPK